MTTSPIYDPDAEENTIAAILEGGSDAIAKINGINLEPSDFWQTRLNKTYAAIQTLHQQNKNIDFVTVSDVLDERKQLTEIGGSSYLAGLLTRLSTYLHVAEYAKIVKRDAMRRKIERAAMELAKLARSDHSSKSLSDIARDFEAVQKVYLNGHGESILVAGPKKPVFKPLSMAELINRPAKQWIVDKIFGAGDVGMLFGESEAGKTFVVIDLILTCLTAKPFAGEYNVKRPLSVAYMTDEGLDGLGQRFAAACGAYHVKPENLDRFYFFGTVPQLFDINSEFNIRRFILDFIDVAPDGVDLVIIDTLGNATLGGKEDGNDEANIVASRIKEIVKTLGCTVLVIHHTGWNEKGRPRGASAYKGHCDFMLGLSKEDDDNSILEFYKIKEGSKPPKLRAARVVNPNLPAPIINWETGSDDKQGQEDEVTTTMLEYPGQRMTAKEINELIPEITQKNLNNILARLVAKEVISRAMRYSEKTKSNRNPWVYWIGRVQSHTS